MSRAHTSAKPPVSRGEPGGVRAKSRKENRRNSGYSGNGRSRGRKAGARAGHSRLPLARIWFIHERLSAGRYPNCNLLAAELEVSPKTVGRDIAFMRDDLGLPIAYHETRFGYFYTEPVRQFPLFQVTEGELLALFVAHKALEPLQGTSFEEKMRGALGKLSGMLGDTVSFSWGDMDGAFSFRKLAATKADLEHFERLSQAVLKRREVEFEYRKLGSPGHALRCVQPYHLGNVENGWYLFGFDLDRGQIRTFALQRMQNVRLTRRGFGRPDFRIEEHLGDSFGVFRDGKGKKQPVRIRFDPFAAQLVRERRWHASQKIRELPDGKLELSLTLGNLFEVERWVLSWGEHAEVLAPAPFRRRMAAIGHALTSRYIRA